MVQNSSQPLPALAVAGSAVGVGLGVDTVVVVVEDELVSTGRGEAVDEADSVGAGVLVVRDDDSVTVVDVEEPGVFSVVVVEVSSVVVVALDPGATAVVVD